MAISEETKKSFDFAADLVKQILTLSTGVITITVAAARFVFVDASSQGMDYMFCAWILFSISIVFGILGLMSLTGNLVRPGTQEDGVTAAEPDIYNGVSTLLIGIHLIAFFFGILLVVAFAYTAHACEPVDPSWLCRLLI